MLAARIADSDTRGISGMDAWGSRARLALAFRGATVYLWCPCNHAHTHYYTHACSQDERARTHFRPEPRGPAPGALPPSPRPGPSWTPGPRACRPRGPRHAESSPWPRSRPRSRWNGSFKGAGGVAGWYSWISLVSYPVDTRVNHTRDRSLTVAIYGYNLLPPGPEDWQEIQ